MNLVENIVKTTKAGVYCVLKADEGENRFIDLNELVIEFKEEEKRKE